MSADSLAHASIQVQEVPGIGLPDLKKMVEDALAAKVQDFTRLSSQDRKLNGHDVYEFVCSMKKDGVFQKATMLLCKPDNTLYIVISTNL